MSEVVRRRTRRGLTQCVKCGTYNGNRAHHCRNCNYGKSKNRKPTSQPSPHASETLFANLFDNCNSSNLSFSDDTFVDSIIEKLQEHNCKLNDRIELVDCSSGQLVEIGTSNRNQTNHSEKNNGLSLGFVEWLSSVTERINQTMHFQCPGKPDPLVFHISEDFFNCFHKRMSISENTKSERLRLPDKVESFTRHTSVPLGKFTIYIWNIYSLSTVSRLFSTHSVQLKVIQYFQQNADGSFSEVKDDSSTTYVYLDSEGYTTNIRPGRLATFLTIGQGIGGLSKKIPFTIEWIPNILPITKVGELRIIFKFEHKSR